MACSPVAFASDAGSLQSYQPETFWGWLQSIDNSSWNFWKSLLDKDICPKSPNTNGRHEFVQTATTVDGKDGLFYVCRYFTISKNLPVITTAKNKRTTFLTKIKARNRRRQNIKNKINFNKTVITGTAYFMSAATAAILPISWARRCTSSRSIPSPPLATIQRGG